MEFHFLRIDSTQAQCCVSSMHSFPFTKPNPQNHLLLVNYGEGELPTHGDGGGEGYYLDT